MADGFKAGLVASSLSWSHAMYAFGVGQESAYDVDSVVSTRFFAFGGVR